MTLPRPRARHATVHAVDDGDRLLVPGAVDRAFGPADVNMAQAPKPPTGQPAPVPGAAKKITKLR